MLQTYKIEDFNFENGEADIEELCNRMAKSINELDGKKHVVKMTAVDTELMTESNIETGMAKS